MFGTRTFWQRALIGFCILLVLVAMVIVLFSFLIEQPATSVDTGRQPDLTGDLEGNSNAEISNFIPADENDQYVPAVLAPVPLPLSAPGNGVTDFEQAAQADRYNPAVLAEDPQISLNTATYTPAVLGEIEL